MTTRGISHNKITADPLNYKEGAVYFNTAKGCLEIGNKFGKGDIVAEKDNYRIFATIAERDAYTAEEGLLCVVDGKFYRYNDGWKEIQIDNYLIVDSLDSIAPKKGQIACVADTLKKYQYDGGEWNEIFYGSQRAVLPEASAEELNRIYQFTGVEPGFTTGYFYQCVADGEAFKWVEMPVQKVFAPINFTKEEANYFADASKAEIAELLENGFSVYGKFEGYFFELQNNQAPYSFAVLIEGVQKVFTVDDTVTYKEFDLNNVWKTWEE